MSPRHDPLAQRCIDKAGGRRRPHPRAAVAELNWCEETAPPG